MAEFEIKETDDFYPLSVLFHESGMGVKVENQRPDRILKMWRMDDKNTGELMAAATLEIRDNVFSLGDIAVRKDLHRMGYGRMMQKIVFEEARKRNVKELWACAKEPDYYLRSGWQQMKWDESPNVAIYCADCEKRNIECHPEIMKYTFE